MRKISFLLAIMATAFGGYGQEKELSDNLPVALKYSTEKIRENSANEILYAKNNSTKTIKDKEEEKKAADFFEVYSNNDQNIYYKSNNDPVITNMPASGPNLNYYSIDRNSSGNYMTVKE